MKLSVHLVSWNGAKYIPLLFKSLREQTFKDWFVFIWDNNSSDNTVELIKNEVNNLGVQYKIIESKENLGFAGGHNEVFKKTDGGYVLLLNQDMYLSPDCFEKLLDFLDSHHEAAAVSPRLMKWDFANGAFTNTIDTLGLKVFKNRRVVDWQAGEEWRGNVIPAEAGIQLEVFGISGALPMYRRAALETVAFYNGDFFDASYHSYKEDVDLAYRLASAGFKSYVLSDAVAYHDRAGAGPNTITDAAAAVNKKRQSVWVKYHSYKNHLMTLYKNEYWQNFLLDFPWILWYEVKKFAYFLLLDRGVLAGLKEVWKMRKELLAKRKWIIKKRKIGWRNIREIFNF
ncbi:MAG: glycosyltransferase family 2 protein [Patescibacteria group bacterium]